MNLINLDYESKLRQDFLDFFNKAKYNSKQVEELFHLYCNKINKQISKNKYKVFMSKELIENTSSLKNIIVKIKKDFENNNISLLNKRLNKASIEEDKNDIYPNY